MKILKGASLDIVVHEWLAAELESPRFREKLLESINETGQSVKLIQAANLEDSAENESRRTVLRNYRGNFWDGIKDKQWCCIELTPDEAGKVIYTNDSRWIKLSGGTRVVGDAAGLIGSSSNKDHGMFLELADSIKEGLEVPPIILIEDQELGCLEVLEGHLRITAFVLSNSTKAPLRAYLGTI